MRTKRKLLAVVLTLALALSLLPVSAFAAPAETKPVAKPTITATQTSNSNEIALTVSVANPDESTNPKASDVLGSIEFSVNPALPSGTSLPTVTLGDGWSYSDGLTIAMPDETATQEYKFKATITLKNGVEGYTLSDGVSEEVSVNYNYTKTPENPTPVAAPASVAIDGSSTDTSKKVTWTYTAENLAKISKFTVQVMKKGADSAPDTTVGTAVDVQKEADKTSYEYTYAVPSDLGAGNYFFKVTAVAVDTTANTDADASTATFEVTGGTTEPDALTAPKVTYTHATKTVGWSTVPAGVTQIAIGLYSTAPADGAEGTAVNGFTKKTLETGATYVLTNTELGTLTDTDLNGKYIGVTFTKGNEKKTGYSAAINTSGTPDPEPGTPKITELKFTGSELTWTYNGTEPTPAFTIAVYNDATAGVITAAAPVTYTRTANAYKAAFTLDSEIAAGTKCKLILSCTSDEDVVDVACVYTIPTSVTPDPPTSGTGAVDSVNDVFEDVKNNLSDAGAVQQAVEQIAANTNGMTDTAKASYAEEIVKPTGNDDVTEKIAALEEAAGVKPTVTNDAVTAIGTPTVVGLGLNAATAGTAPTLTVSATAEKPSKPTNTGITFFSLTVTGVVDSTSLKHPAVITVTIPTSIRGTNKTYSVIHYAANGSYTEVPSYEFDGSITFATWGFSDFAIVAEGGDSGSSSGGGGHKGSSSTGGGKVVVSTKPEDTTTTTLPASGFSDVPDTHTFASEIKWAKDNGYMNGTGEGVFSPSGTVNRQQIWMVLARMAGASPANMAEALTWAVENGISDGTNPTAAVSRQQLVTMMYRFAQKQENAPSEAGADISSFSDAASVSGYAQEAIAWSVANNIVGGTADGRINPYGNATRGAFAAILYRYYN